MKSWFGISRGYTELDGGTEEEGLDPEAGYPQENKKEDWEMSVTEERKRRTRITRMSIHPMNVDTVKIKVFLIMMRQCLLFDKLTQAFRQSSVEGGCLKK